MHKFFKYIYHNPLHVSSDILLILGQIILIQHLLSSLSVSDRPVHRFSTCAPDGYLLRGRIPAAVLIQFDLLRMSKISLETC